MKQLKFKSHGIGELKEGIVSGYASKFGNVDSDGDIIAKGAYEKTLSDRGDRIAFLWQHDIHQPLGKPQAMREDLKGLFVEAKISDTSLGRDVKTMIEDEVIKEFSVGFVPVVQEYNKETDINTIKEIKLFEFSLVTIAANPEAVVTGMKGEFKPIDEIDRVIRLVKKLDSDQAKNIIEFELLKLAEYLKGPLRSTPEPSVDTQGLKELDELIKNFKR